LMIFYCCFCLFFIFPFLECFLLKTYDSTPIIGTKYFFKKNRNNNSPNEYLLSHEFNLNNHNNYLYKFNGKISFQNNLLTEIKGIYVLNIFPNYIINELSKFNLKTSCNLYIDDVTNELGDFIDYKIENLKEYFDLYEDLISDISLLKLSLNQIKQKNKKTKKKFLYHYIKIMFGIYF